jgi:hypothetical protein
MLDEVTESLTDVSPYVTSCTVVSREKFGKVTISVETVEQSKFIIEYSPQHGYSTVI